MKQHVVNGIEVLRSQRRQEAFDAELREGQAPDACDVGLRELRHILRACVGVLSQLISGESAEF